MRRRTTSVLPPALLAIAVLGAWELYADSGSTSSSILPAPHAIAEALCVVLSCPVRVEA